MEIFFANICRAQMQTTTSARVPSFMHVTQLLHSRVRRGSTRRFARSKLEPWRSEQNFTCTQNLYANRDCLTKVMNVVHFMRLF